MGRRNRGRKRKKQAQAAKQPRVTNSPMTKEKIAQVKMWLERMQVNALRATNLSQRMSLDDLNESNDLFWALAKYTENVQESAKKLDGINKNIYPALIEFDEDTWGNLKRMRDRLAHKFWDIDSQILWETATSDFPDLLALLSTIAVYDKPVSDGERVDSDVVTDRLLGLPAHAPGSAVEAGQFLISMVFGHDGKVGVIRVGHDGSGKLVMHANFDSRMTVLGQRRHGFNQ